MIYSNNSNSLSTREALQYCNTLNYPITKQGLKYIGITHKFLTIKKHKWYINKKELYQYIKHAKILPASGWITIRKASIIFNLSWARVSRIIKENNLPFKYYGAGKGVKYVEEINFRKVLEKYRRYNKGKK